MKTKVLFLAMLAMIMGLPGLAAAQMEGDTVHLSIMGGGIFPSDALDSGPVYGLGVGYNFNKNWGLEVFTHFAPNLDFENYTAEDRADGRDRDADLFLARLNGLYHFDTGSKFTPYVTAGVGGIKANSDEGHYNSFSANAGLGFKYFFNEVVALRLEANEVYGFKKDGGDRIDGPMVTAGLTFQFGGNPACRDSDKDGVCDDYDKCPGTPAGYKVDADGCPKTVSIRLDVKFDFNKDVVKPQYRNEIQKVADFMTSHPGTSTVVEGHTDSVGSDTYNQGLSERRASAVRQSLVNDFNISPSRVSAVGYGESKPEASNATAAGRAQNRRVVGVVSGTDIDQ